MADPAFGLDHGPTYPPSTKNPYPALGTSSPNSAPNCIEPRLWFDEIKLPAPPYIPNLGLAASWPRHSDGAKANTITNVATKRGTLCLTLAFHPSPDYRVRRESLSNENCHWAIALPVC